MSTALKLMRMDHDILFPVRDLFVYLERGKGRMKARRKAKEDRRSK